jgi:hypothetical protein
MKKLTITLFTIFLLAFSVSSVYAQNPPQQTANTGRPTTNQPQSSTNANNSLPTLPNPLKVGSIPELIQLLVNAALSISYAVVAFFILYSGFKFVTAQGSEDKLKDAKNTFKYTIIGAILVIGATTIAKILENVIKGLQ